MSYWTKEELKIAYEAKAYAETISNIVNELRANGYYRSYNAVKKMFLRRKNNVKIEEIKSVKELIPISGPKILFLDIETLPIVAYTWGLWKQNISHGQILSDWCLLSWSAKWLNDSNVYSDVLTPDEAVNRKDKRISKSMWDLINEADIIVAHNGDDFDVKKLNSRFIINGLEPPSPYRTIDTLKQSRKNFGFTSNKLDYLSELISNKNKIKTDFELWRCCDMGVPEALEEMVTYNKYDVVLLEEIYLAMLPWMKGLPNFTIYTNMDKRICGHCGSTKLIENGFYMTPANKYRSYKCKTCGCFVRDRVSSLTKAQRKNLLINLS